MTGRSGQHAHVCYLLARQQILTVGMRPTGSCGAGAGLGGQIVGPAGCLQCMTEDRARRRRGARYLRQTTSGRIIRAGFPPTSAPLGTSDVTTLPAATTAPAPIVTPPKMVAPVPIHTSSSIIIG